MTTTASDDRDALKIRRREPDLIRAAGEGDLARVRKLLDAGVDPMAHHARTGQCALIEATRAGAYHCVRELVARITATEADAQARNAEERGAALSAPSPGAWKDRHNPHHKFEAQLEGALSAAANEGFHYCVEALLPALPTRRISVAQKPCRSLHITDTLPALRFCLVFAAATPHTTPWRPQQGAGTLNV